MSNHLHIVLRNRPDVVRSWSDDEVARRWWQLFPRRRDESGDPASPQESDLSMVTSDADKLAEIRKRLSNIGWFMRCVAEPVARMANREDECTGRFWEGRYKCQPLLDESAIAACMAYADLNPVRAGIAKTPESSQFTSAFERLKDARSEGQHGWSLPLLPPKSPGEIDDAFHQALAKCRHECCVSFRQARQILLELPLFLRSHLAMASLKSQRFLSTGCRFVIQLKAGQLSCVEPDEFAIATFVDVKRSRPFPTLFVHWLSTTRAAKNVLAIFVTIADCFLFQVFRGFLSASVDVRGPSGSHKVTVTGVATEYREPFIATAVQSRKAGWAFHGGSRPLNGKNIRRRPGTKLKASNDQSIALRGRRQNYIEGVRAGGTARVIVSRNDRMIHRSRAVSIGRSTKHRFLMVRHLVAARPSHSDGPPCDK